MTKSIIPTPFGLVQLDTSTPSYPSIFGGNKGFKVDVKETENEYEVKADFPGVDKKDVNISLKDDILTISYKHDSEDGKKDEDGQWVFHERKTSSMQRSFTLPESSEEGATASMDDGVLTITVPKKPHEEPESTTIEIS